MSKGNHQFVLNISGLSCQLNPQLPGIVIATTSGGLRNYHRVSANLLWGCTNPLFGKSYVENERIWIKPMKMVGLLGVFPASWSLTKELGLNPVTVMTNIFVTNFTEFSENI